MDSQSDNQSNDKNKSKSPEELLQYINSDEFKQLEIQFPIPGPKDSSKS